MTIEDIDRTASFLNDAHDEVIIKVVGVGGGGDNAVNYMYNQGINKVSFVVCNTDAQALNKSVVPDKLLIGPQTCRGRGAGNVPEKARMAAEESAEAIGRLFEDETQMVFITAGMGGGTGTGAAPVVARIAKEKGMLTIGIVTIPFTFEGDKKIFKALEGAKEMHKYVDALLVVNNEQLIEIYPDLSLANGFAKADDTLANAARSISELITSEGYMNLDFEDVKTTLQNGGAALISTGYGEGEQRVTKAIQNALESPLLKNKDIYGSKHLLFNIYCDPNAEHPFIMREAEELNTFVTSIDNDVDVIYGVSYEEGLGDKVKITILASGFELSIQQEHDEKALARKPLLGRKPAPVLDEAESQRKIMEEMYGKEKVEEIARQRAANRYIVLKPEQFDDDDVIEKFEHNPTFTRDKRLVDGVRQAAAAKPTSPLAADRPDSAAATPTSTTPQSPDHREIVF